MFLEWKIFLNIFYQVLKVFDFAVFHSTFLLFHPLFPDWSLLLQIIDHLLITFMFGHEMLHFVLALKIILPRSDVISKRIYRWLSSCWQTNFMRIKNEKLQKLLKLLLTPHWLFFSGIFFFGIALLFLHFFPGIFLKFNYQIFILNNCTFIDMLNF